jgi:hypothetical protein
MCTIPPALLLSSGAPLHWPENNDDFEQPDTEKKSHREARWDLWKFKLSVSIRRSFSESIFGIFPHLRAYKKDIWIRRVRTDGLKVAHLDPSGRMRVEAR